MTFEWDERKREANIQKHGVDFLRAAKIFANPILERIDDRGDYGEERRIAIGQWEGSYTVVIYTWRGESRRIISAWKAGKDDRRKYNKRIFGRS